MTDLFQSIFYLFISVLLRCFMCSWLCYVACVICLAYYGGKLYNIVKAYRKSLSF